MGPMKLSWWMRRPRCASDCGTHGRYSAAHQLSELREIALLFAADVVDHQLESYLKHKRHRRFFRNAGANSGLHHAAQQRARR